MSFIDKIIIVNGDNKRNGIKGLVAKETDKTVCVISFIKNDPKQCRYNEIFVKSRPYQYFRINKKFVKKISEKSIKPSILKMARGQGRDIYGLKTTKPYNKRDWTTTYKC